MCGKVKRGRRWWWRRRSRRKRIYEKEEEKLNFATCTSSNINCIMKWTVVFVARDFEIQRKRIFPKEMSCKYHWRATFHSLRHIRKTLCIISQVKEENVLIFIFIFSVHCNFLSSPWSEKYQIARLAMPCHNCTECFPSVYDIQVDWLFQFPPIEYFKHIFRSLSLAIATRVCSK